MLFLSCVCYAFVRACLLPAEKGLTSRYFPTGILGQVWYLIVSIPDRCPLSYSDKTLIMHHH